MATQAAISQTVTPEEVWQMFREIAERFRDSEREFRDIKAGFKELEQRFKETDRRFQETDSRFKELEQRFKDTDRYLKDLARESDRQFKQLRREVGKVTDSLGYFAESMVEPALVRLFQERGISINHTATNLTCREPGLEMEVDLVGVNNEYVVAVEVKSKLRVEDVNRHLERLAHFKEAFPMYRDKQLLGAVAGMSVPADVGRYAYKKGLYVLAQSGETMKILNDEDFQPRVW